MGIETYFEGSGHSGYPTTELVLGIFETFGYVVNGLVFLILIGLYGGGCGFECTMFTFVGDGMQQFAVRGQETSTISLDLAMFFAQTEFNSEPVDLNVKNETEKKIFFHK